MKEISESEGQQIAEILSRRANEIAGYSSDSKDKMPASVELGLTREIERLRNLAYKVRPVPPHHLENED